MNNIIFIGAPGSGKGTQTKIISEKFGIPTISTGDLLRSEVNRKTELGILAEKYMNSGNLVPDEFVVDMVKNRISKDDCAKGFILDGFPRNLEQAVFLDESLKSISKSISLVIVLEVPDDIIIKRISGRFSCADCGALYNKFFSDTRQKGICDNCGSKNFISRSDDNEEAVKKRLDVYHSNAEKLIGFYRKKGLIYKVDGLKPTGLVNQDIIERIN